MDLWQVITEEVYSLLESRGGLERREVILAKESGASSSKESDASSSKELEESGVRSFVFVSPGFESKERLQVDALPSVHAAQCAHCIVAHCSGTLHTVVAHCTL